MKKLFSVLFLISLFFCFFNTTQSFAGDNAGYVADVKIPDGTVVDAGKTFEKVWRIKNNGSTTWDSNYCWERDGGPKLDAEPDGVCVKGKVKPGDTYDFSVKLTAPDNNGTFKAFWKMKNKSGDKFGDRCWVEIKVVNKKPDSSEKMEKAAVWAEKKVGSTDYCTSGISWCLKFARDAYNGKSLGYNSAADMYDDLKSKGKINNPEKNGWLKAPRGALVFFQRSTFCANNECYGHVAIYIGNNNMVGGLCPKVKQDDISSSSFWSSKYVGWAYSPW